MARKSISKFNVAVTQQSGKVGNVRYYQKAGETYVRSAHNSVTTNPRTDKQMVHRLQFASRTALWTAMRGNLKNGFSNKPNNQSDFNAFMALNDGKGVFLTKQQLAQGAQIIFPVQITNGRLDSIHSVMEDGCVKSDIALGSLVLGDDTTVGDFANAVVTLNEDFDYGDEIAFISIHQSVNTEGIPKVRGHFHRIILAKGDVRLVHDLVSEEGFQTVDGCLGSVEEMPVGCYAYVHSRRENSLQVSSQVLVDNNTELIEAYTSDEQYEKARNSYGYYSEVFLDPASNGQGGEEPGPVPPTDLKTVSLSVPSAMQSMGDVQINDRTKAKSDTLQVAAGTSVTIKAIPVSGDYQFNAWSDGNTSATRSLTVSEDISLTASFSPVE